jgi:hypothetical protein
MNRLVFFQRLSQTAHALAFWMLLTGLARAETSTPWPEVPLPPHATVEWVGDRMKLNGIPMRVMRFESTASRTEIVAYYTAHWSGAYRTKPSVTPLGDTTLVGQAHGPYYMTVKVGDAPHDGSAGYISVSQILGNRVERSSGGLPLMPGARILSVLESGDLGKQCRELVISQDAGADSARRYYEAALHSAGWHAVQSASADPTGPRPPASFEVYRRDASELSITVMAGDGGRGSTLVATLVTKGSDPLTE